MTGINLLHVSAPGCHPQGVFQIKGMYTQHAHRHQWKLLKYSSSSSSIGTTAHYGLWPSEQCPSIFFLSATNSLHLLTPSTGRSLYTSSFHLFLGLPLLLVPSSS